MKIFYLTCEVLNDKGNLIKNILTSVILIPIFASK